MFFILKIFLQADFFFRFLRRNSYFFETKVELNSTDDIARRTHGVTN